MSGLVQPHLAPARQAQARQAPPPGFGDCGERRSFSGQLVHRCVQVVAHQVELMRRGAFGGVHGDLGGRKLEDQPVGSGVDIRVVEHVPKEGTSGFGAVTVDDDVGAVDHGTSLTARGPGADR